MSDHFLYHYLYKSILISPYSSAVPVETLLTNSLVTKSQIQCTSFKYSFVLERDACGGRTFYLMMCAELSPSGPLPLQLPGRHFWEVLFWTIFFHGGVGNLFIVIYLIYSQSVACLTPGLDYSVSLMHLEVGVEDYL